MNPDDLLAAIRALRDDARLAVRPDPRPQSGAKRPRRSKSAAKPQQERKEDALTAELLAKARARVKEARHDGFLDSEIDAYLREEIGIGLEEVMDPRLGDYIRAASMGATFGFVDELAGAGAALIPGGKDYREARDAVRERHEMARYAAPMRMLSAELLGAAAPALLTLGATGAAQGAATGTRTLGALGLGAGVGAVSGLGNSEETSLRGMAEDAALGGALGAGTSAAFLGAGGLGRAASYRLSPSRAVTREAASVLPEDAAQVMARQEALVPGTAVLADQSPEMLLFAQAIGRDRTATKRALHEASERVRVIERFRDVLRSVRGDADADVQFLTDRLAAARALEQTLKQSGAQHAAARAAGMAPASLDASILRRPSLMDIVAKLIQPSQERRARVAERLLTSPSGRERAMSLMAPSPSVFPYVGRGLLTGTSVVMPSFVVGGA